VADAVPEAAVGANAVAAGRADNIRIIFPAFSR